MEWNRILLSAWKILNGTDLESIILKPSPAAKPGRKDKDMINNILEMRNDYNDIYIRCSICRDLPTATERRREAAQICKDFNIIFEKYAIVDLIGKEFLKREA